MKTKKFTEWQADEVRAKAQKEWELKERQKDEAANKYRVIEDGEVVHETSSEAEAVRMAEKINGKVLWVLDNCGIRYIYPPKK